MNEKSAITVGQLNTYVKSLLEGDVHLAYVTVIGEISNFKNHYQSGHWYFTLKDENASVKCVMFRSFASKVAFIANDGIKVFVRAKATLYDREGSFQLYVEEMHEAGLGDAALRFNQIKEKLQKEGLFDEENKRPLCRFPKKIAVVTSDTGAAVQDIKNILGKRFPVCEIIMCPVAVQGDQAAAEMIKTLDRVYSLDDIDTVIIGRGGGSAEDLSAFNDEALARKIYESPFPIISAVGHEIDFSISDFVADVRASTPSHAAELAVPDAFELFAYIKEFPKRFTNLLENKLKTADLELSKIKAMNVYKNPLSLVLPREQAVDTQSFSLHTNFEKLIGKKDGDFKAAVGRFDTLSPLKILSRGYVAADKNGKTIKTVNDLESGDGLTLTFSDGKAFCTVNGKEKYNG